MMHIIFYSLYNKIRCVHIYICICIYIYFRRIKRHKEKKRKEDQSVRNKLVCSRTKKSKAYVYIQTQAANR